MAIMALNIELVNNGSLSPDQPVLFDKVKFQNGGILYNPATGEITFSSPGSYSVSWWISSQSAASNSGISFALMEQGTKAYSSASSVKTGQLNGFGLFEVTHVPFVLTLVNTSSGPVFYSSLGTPKAAMNIYSLDAETAPPSMTGNCFGTAQMTHIIEQLIIYYPDSLMTVYNQNMYSVSGKPLEIFSPPFASGGGLFVLLNTGNQKEAVPITHITAVFTGSGTVYNPAITYLLPPSPFPAGCEMDVLMAIKEYLPLGTETALQTGTLVQASGQVYKNELGVLVVSDCDGNTPIFIQSSLIQRIVTANDPLFTSSEPKGATISLL